MVRWFQEDTYLIDLADDWGRRFPVCRRANDRQAGGTRVPRPGTGAARRLETPTAIQVGEPGPVR